MNELAINLVPLTILFIISFVFGGFVVYHFIRHQDKQNQRTHDYSMKVEDNRTDIVKSSLSNLHNPTENDKIFRMLLTADSTAIAELQEKQASLLAEQEHIKARFEALYRLVGEGKK